jgi:ribonucleoside-diphosphate reductase alpha chain
MMAAAQPFISGAISKTVIMPNNATVQDIESAYMMAWELGLKALAVYRDGSKGAQPLSTSNDADKKERKEKRKTSQGRERLPDTRNSMTHKFNVSGHEGYITVGLYPDGRVGEIFIRMAKEGSTIGGLMDCFSIAISMGLQYGVPLRACVEKFSHTKFEPWGHTKNQDIPQAKSLVDYIFRWLGRTFLPADQSVQQDPQNKRDLEGDGAERHRGKALVESKRSLDTKPERVSITSIAVIDSSVAESSERPKAETFTITTAGEQYEHFQSDAPLCDACGAITMRNGNCFLCYNCGKSMGCS